MASQLPLEGEASYNGFTFPVETTTESIEVAPQYDVSGRTVVCSVFSVTLKTVISDADSTDATVQDIVEKLTKPAGVFKYVAKGFGGLTINVGKKKDVLWGPKPQMLSFRPIGGKRACELTWRCDVAIPTCNDAVFSGQLMEIGFKVTYDVDRSGYTKRTYSGFCRIPATRKGVNDRRLPDSADEYREQVVPRLLPGFRRIPGGFTLSEDRCRLDFNVVDEQMGPNAPPPGMVEADVEHNFSNSPGKPLFWTGMLSATYEIALGSRYSAGDAARYFFALAADRIQHLASSIGKNANTIIPIQFSFGEPSVIGKRMAKFSLSYYVSGVTFGDIMSASGLWRPVPNSNWKLWAQSLGATAGSRGNAQLTFDLGDDKIIDLCEPIQQIQTLSGGGGPPSQQVQVMSGGGGIGGGIGPSGGQISDLVGSAFPKPGAGASWMDYQSFVRTETDSGVSVLKRLPLTEAELVAGPNTPVAGPKTGLPTGGPPPGQSSLSTGAAPGAGSLTGGQPPSTAAPAGSSERGAVSPGDDKPSQAYSGGAYAGDLGYGYGIKDNPLGSTEGFTGIFQGSAPPAGDWHFVPSPKPGGDDASSSKPGPNTQDVEWVAGYGVSPVIAKKPSTSGARKPAETIVQQRTSQTVYIFLEGSAVRAGYPVPMPTLKDVGGVKPIPANRADRGEGFSSGIIGSAYGTPLYGARWRLRYVLTEVPKGWVAVPDNPLQR